MVIECAASGRLATKSAGLGLGLNGRKAIWQKQVCYEWTVTVKCIWHSFFSMCFTFMYILLCFYVYISVPLFVFVFSLTPYCVN